VHAGAPPHAPLAAGCGSSTDCWDSGTLLLASLLLLGAVALFCADRAYCMPGDRIRVDAFKSAVVFELGAGAGDAPRWRPLCTIPTLHSLQPFRDYARRRGLNIDSWLYSDSSECPLEACAGRWRLAVQALAFDVRNSVVPSVGDSVAAFNLHVRPLERAQGTRGKYETHHLSVLTWAIWKDVLASLLPMSEDLFRAYLWDFLAFEASLCFRIASQPSRPGINA
jgi:hypothetical protein